MGFLDDDTNSFLVLASVVLVIPTVLLMRWHPGWWVVSLGTVSLFLNAVLAADGIVDSFQIDGTGRKTAIGAAIYSAFATLSSAVGTFRMGNMDFKAKRRHVLGALLLSGIGGVATLGLVGMQLTYKGDRPLATELPKTLCALKAPICSPRFAFAVLLLWVSLGAQIIIDCFGERVHQALQAVLQVGRIAGAVGFAIIVVGAYRSYSRDGEPGGGDPPNLYGRLTLMVTVTAPYVGYAATSWVHHRTHHARAVALRKAVTVSRAPSPAGGVQQGGGWGGGPPPAVVAPPPNVALPPLAGGTFPPPAMVFPPPWGPFPPPGGAVPPHAVPLPRPHAVPLPPPHPVQFPPPHPVPFPPPHPVPFPPPPVVLLPPPPARLR